MRHMHRHVPALALYLALFLACISLAATPACGGNQRQKTLHASVLAVNAARDGLLAYDREQEIRIGKTAGTTRAEAELALATYHAKLRVVFAAFDVAYSALALAATTDDDLSYKQAMTAAAAVLEAANAFMKGM